MKNSITALIVIITICSLFCCTHQQNVGENLISFDEVITSTDESVLTQVNKKLKETIRNDVYRIEGEITGFEITATENIENDNLNAINIQFVTDSGLESNVILVIRKENTGTSYDSYTASCGASNDCKVTITDEGDGSFFYTCTEACCDLTIEEVEFIIST